MEIKGIDVSAWNKKIDWKAVADYGMDFVILRVTEIENKVDSTFEFNYKECIKHHIPVGVYKYSYALSEKEAQEEAKKVVDTLNGRKLNFPVFYDLEWEPQRKLGKNKIERIAEAFISIVKQAGYKVGIYCNEDWYENVLMDNLKEYDFWIASYPYEKEDKGWLEERLRPNYGAGWQYSQFATIPGISTKVDRNVFYKNYMENEKEDKNMTVNEAIKKVINIAESEIGYLEKRSNGQLDNKTANAGSSNYTKYWRDVKPSYQGQPWCAGFVTWVFDKAFGKTNTKKLLKHYPYVYCPTLGDLFTRHANPKVGDIVIFWRGGTFAHTGIVTKVDGDKFWTIEGNTSGASGIVANGGGVCRKSYYNSNMIGTKFCRPDYSIVAEYKIEDELTDGTNSNDERKEYMFNPKTVKKGDKNTSVLLLQEILRARGFKGKDGKELKLDWEAKENTIYALTEYQKKRKGILVADGVCGDATWKDLISI